MRQALLKCGDTFVLEVGQRVYMKAQGYSDLEVIIGRLTAHQEFRYDEIKVDGHTYHSDGSWVSVEHPIPPSGKYRVVRTCYGGGGTAMGPHDVFPDGHRVYARPVGKTKPTVSFYQTGCFTAMLPEPNIVSRRKSCAK